MIGEVHRRAAVLAGATVVGVMASSPDRSRQVAEEWRVEQAYSDLDEVVAKRRRRFSAKGVPPELAVHAVRSR